MYSLIKLDQSYKSFHEYTRDFNSSYSYLKDDISVKAASYLYIGGLRNGSLRADLMSNWHARKYATLMALHTDVAKNSLWRSSIVIKPKTGGSNTHQNKGKTPMTQPNFKRPQLSNFGHKILAVTAALEAVVINVPQAVRDRGDKQRTIKQILKGLQSHYFFQQKYETGEE